MLFKASVTSRMFVAPSLAGYAQAREPTEHSADNCCMFVDIMVIADNSESEFSNESVTNNFLEEKILLGS